MRGRRFQRNRACANSVPPKITPRYLLNLPSSLSHIGAKSPLSIAESLSVTPFWRSCDTATFCWSCRQAVSSLSFALPYFKDLISDLEVP